MHHPYSEKVRLQIVLRTNVSSWDEVSCKKAAHQPCKNSASSVGAPQQKQRSSKVFSYLGRLAEDIVLFSKRLFKFWPFTSFTTPVSPLGMYVEEEVQVVLETL